MPTLSPRTRAGSWQRASRRHACSVRAAGTPCCLLFRRQPAAAQKAFPKAKNISLKQDEDVLDTW